MDGARRDRRLRRDRVPRRRGRAAAPPVARDGERDDDRRRDDRDRGEERRLPHHSPLRTARRVSPQAESASRTAGSSALATTTGSSPSARSSATSSVSRSSLAWRRAAASPRREANRARPARGRVGERHDEPLDGREALLPDRVLEDHRHDVPAVRERARPPGRLRRREEVGADEDERAGRQRAADVDELGERVVERAPRRPRTASRPDAARRARRPRPRSAASHEAGPRSRPRRGSRRGRARRARSTRRASRARAARPACSATARDRGPSTAGGRPTITTRGASSAKCSRTTNSGSAARRREPCGGLPVDRGEAVAPAGTAASRRRSTRAPAATRGAGRTGSRPAASAGRGGRSARSRRLLVAAAASSGTGAISTQRAASVSSSSSARRAARLGEERRREHDAVAEHGREQREHVLGPDVAPPVQERPGARCALEREAAAHRGADRRPARAAASRGRDRRASARSARRRRRRRPRPGDAAARATPSVGRSRSSGWPPRWSRMTSSSSSADG